MLEGLPYKTSKTGNALVIQFSGSVENDTQQISAESVGQLLDGGNKVIALDLSQVKKFLSVSITHLIKLLRTVEGKQGTLYLVNVPEQVMKVLSMVNIISKFQILHSTAELSSIGSGSAEAAPTALKVKKSTQGDEHTIALQGSLVEGTKADALLEAVNDALGRGVKSISLDFAKTEVLDTYSIGTLLKIHDMCQQDMVLVKAVNTNQLVSHVLKTNEVDRLFGL